MATACVMTAHVYLHRHDVTGADAEITALSSPGAGGFCETICRVNDRLHGASCVQGSAQNVHAHCCIRICDHMHACTTLSHMHEYAWTCIHCNTLCNNSYMCTYLLNAHKSTRRTTLYTIHKTQHASPGTISSSMHNQRRFTSAASQAPFF